MTLVQVRELLRLDEGAKRVLVVEDAGDHYEEMVRWLQGEGHGVSGFGEVYELVDGVMTGRTLYGEEVSVEVATLDVAFLDFYFPRAPWNGGRLARALISGNPQIRAFGMSSVAGKNVEMVREGAIGGMLKRELGALISG